MTDAPMASPEPMTNAPMASPEPMTCADGFAERSSSTATCPRMPAWLPDAVEKFARFGDVSAVVELIKFADPHLSADGFAEHRR